MQAESLTEQAYRTIRTDIVACRLKPGEKINISALCSQLGFSLGAVREALSRLIAEGLVVSEINKGFRVTHITEAELKDLTQTRVLLECECLRNAIQHGDVKWEAGIVSTLFELSRIGLKEKRTPDIPSPERSETHQRFHEALVAACDSPWLLRLRAQTYMQAERYRQFSLQLDRSQRDVDAEHQEIADAAIARDSVRACKAMEHHLRQTTRILLEQNASDDVTLSEPEQRLA